MQFYVPGNYLYGIQLPMNVVKRVMPHFSERHPSNLELFGKEISMET